MVDKNEANDFNIVVKNRNYGIELLRLVLMFMVCILHTLGQGGILDNTLPSTINYKVFWAMEIFAYCAVDSFAIISGYIALNKSQKYERIIDIWFQVFFYSFIVTIILIALGFSDWIGIGNLIKCALPITFGKYWYMTAYFALFFVMPIINKYILSIDDKSAKKMFIVIFFLYSIIGVVTDTFKTFNGYSAIWLIVLYLMGALAKKIKLFEKRRSFSLIIIWFMCLLLTWMVKIYYSSDLFINYISPTILLSAIIMVVLFSRIKIKGNLLSKLAPLSLGIYLFQINQIIWNNIIKDAFIFIVDKRIIIGIIYVLFFSFIIFISGLVIDFIRQLLFKMINITNISKKIVKIGNSIINKFLFILK